MEDIIKIVAEKTGLSPEASKSAIEAVTGYLRDKLPPPIAGQVDRLLAGGTPTLSGAGDLTKSIAGLFGT